MRSRFLFRLKLPFVMCATDALAKHVRDSHPANLWAHCLGRAHSRRYREAIWHEAADLDVRSSVGGWSRAPAPTSSSPRVSGRMSMRPAAIRRQPPPFQGRRLPTSTEA